MSELKYLDGAGVQHFWQKIITKVHELFDSKLDNVVAGDNSMTVSNNNVIQAKVSPTSGNLVEVTQSGIFAQTPDTYRIDKTTDNRYEAVYHLKRIPFGQAEGSDAGQQIIIPKDTTILSGVIVTKAESGAWGAAGTYLEITTNTQQKIYIPVGSVISKDAESILDNQSDDVPTSSAVANYVNRIANYNFGTGLSHEQGTNTVSVNLLSRNRLSGTAAATAEVVNRTYPVSVDASGRLAVNIPWTDSIPVRSVNGKTGYVTLVKKDIDLENVDNTSDVNKPVSIATQAALNEKLNTSLKGANNGLAELDENGFVPTSQLPSFVDDVLEYPDINQFPLEGQSGKIYVDLFDNRTYRWSGSTYTEISPSIALGNTSSTAFRGDYGLAAYNHANQKGSDFVGGLYKIATNAEGHVISAVNVVKSDITGLGIPGDHRTIELNGTELEGSLNIVAGTGINITYNNGTLTISAGSS